MAKKQRVDKVLSNLGYGSRAELKKFCKQGLVFVNGKAVSNPGLQVDTDIDEIVFNGEKINYRFKRKTYDDVNKNWKGGKILAKKHRVDKVLSNLGYGSRAELKKFCKQGLVFVNGKVVSNPGLQVDTDIDEIVFNGEKINYREFKILI